MQKNEEYIVKIIDNGINGEGIAKIDNNVIFIPNAMKNETVKIKILKADKKISFGKIVEIIEKSEYRVTSDCTYYDKCGGCNFRHIDYEESLKVKKNSVQTTMKKFLGKEILVDEIIKMETPKFYRNKLIYPVRCKLRRKSPYGNLC